MGWLRLATAPGESRAYAMLSANRRAAGPQDAQSLPRRAGHGQPPLLLLAALHEHVIVPMRTHTHTRCF